MPEPIFNKGDFVIIKENARELASKEGSRNGSPGWNDSMNGQLGKTYIIERVHTTGRRDCPYWYVINSWKYKPEWLMFAFENEEQAFVSYVEEKVNENSYKKYLKSVKNS